MHVVPNGISHKQRRFWKLICMLNILYAFVGLTQRPKKHWEQAKHSNQVISVYEIKAGVHQKPVFVPHNLGDFWGCLGRDSFSQSFSKIWRK